MRGGNRSRKYISGFRAFAVAITVLSSSSFLVACAYADTSEPPHVVIVMVVDLGWNDVGYTGREIRTPALG